MAIKLKDIKSALLKSLENNGLVIVNCRGQSFKNASKISFKTSGTNQND